MPLRILARVRQAGAASLARDALRSPTVQTFLINALVLGLGLISSVQLARWLGPGGRGELAAAALWPMLLMYLASMGMIQSVLYFSALPGAEPGKVLGTALACAGVQSVLAMGIGYVVLPLLLAKQVPAVVAVSRIFLWVIPVSLISQYCLSVLQAQLRFSAYNAIRLVIPVGYVVAVIALERARALTPSAAVLAMLWLNVAVLVATVAALWWSHTVAHVAPDRKLAVPMLKYGGKVNAGSLPQTANLRLDQALLAAWFPPVQLGLYVAAVSAVSVAEVLSTAVRTVITPRIAQQEPAAGARALQDAFRKYWVASLVGTILLGLVLPFAIPLVYGPSFSGAIPPAMVLLGASICFGARQVLSGGAQALGNPWLASKADIIGAVVTVISLPFLLPRLGIMGAAIATLAAYATQLIVVLYGLSRTHSIWPRSLVSFSTPQWRTATEER